MAMADKMIDADLRAFPIFGDHRIDIQKCRRPVDDDDMRSCCHLRAKIALVVTRRHDHEAINTSLGKSVDCGPFPIGLLVRRCEEYGDASFSKNILNGAVNSRGERVGNINKDNADSGGIGSGSQLARGEIVSVVEALNRLVYAQ